MEHDRIHAREPAHHRDRWSVGRIEEITERDGHCVVTVTADGESVELVVTLAVRELFVIRTAVIRYRRGIALRACQAASKNTTASRKESQQSV